MSLSVRNGVNAELLEKVITNNDLGGLSPLEKVHHIKTVCESLGLNPLTKPIQLIKFQGREIAYFTKDATEQLRKVHKISLKVREAKMMDGGIYLVIVDAKAPDGREDSSTGAISVSGLKGDALCNAMLKAETKAKRRVTLSICGLGFTDESELETMSGAKKIELNDTDRTQFLTQYDTQSNGQYDIQEALLNFSQSTSLQELQNEYTKAYKYFFIQRDKSSLAQLITAKDEKKRELEKDLEFVQIIEEECKDE
jgi:hypothetical protein